MKKLWTLIRSHKVITVVVVVVLAIAAYSYHQEPVSPFETATVEKGDVIQEVSVTGRVNADAEVSLAFEKSGKVSSVPVPVGTHVPAGATLVRIDASDITPLRAQALANLDVELVNLAALRKGTREEDIAVTRAQLESAKSSVAEAQASVLDKASGALTASDDAIHNISDQFFRNPRTRNPEVAFPLTNEKLLIALPAERLALEAVLTAWPAELAGWKQSTDADTAISSTKAHLEQVKTFLDDLALAVNGLLPSSSLSQVTIDGWKLDISSARTSINASLTNMFAVAEKYRTAFEAQKVVEYQLALKIAGPTAETIAAQEARIASVRATIQNYDAQLRKTTITAPFAGVVTKQDAKYGETVSPAVPLVTMMSDAKWKIEANIPEVDVAKVKVNDAAQISFDAYGQDTLFAATVVSIDPAETIVEGVSTYKVTLVLNADDDRVRSGMTANIDIRTDERTDVVRVPLRAVTSDGDKKTVRVPAQDGMSATVVPVELGLRGSDGYTEVLSGLSVGDRVVIYEKK